MNNVDIRMERYMKWSEHEATEEEKKLAAKVSSFEELFEDMCFAEGTKSYNLIECQTQSDSGEWIDDETPRPEVLQCMEYMGHSLFLYKVEPSSHYRGYYDPKKQLLCVSPEALEDDKTILHEMIHMYESIINDLPLYFHDMLYWSLYQDLRAKIEKLDTVISSHAHLLNGSTLYAYGGLHDILFLLKSFDLDIRMGYPLGTIFGYGRTKLFNHLEYNIQE